MYPDIWDDFGKAVKIAFILSIGAAVGLTMLIMRGCQ